MKTFVWNIDRTKAVDIDHIRNFSIESKGVTFDVIGWFSDSQTMVLGSFKDMQLSQKFLEKLLISGEK